MAIPKTKRSLRKQPRHRVRGRLRKPGPVADKKFIRRQRGLPKSWVGFGVVCLLLATGVGFAAVMRSGDGQKDTATVACSNDSVGRRIKNNQALLKSGSAQELRALRDEITALPGYQNSANCLYLLTKVAVATGDAAAAREHLTALTARFDPQQGYDDGLPAGAETPEALAPIVSFLESQASRLIENGKQLQWNDEQ